MHVAAQEIKISAGLNLQPYGPAVLNVIRKAGLNPVVGYYPGERSLAMLSEGEVDAEFARTKTATSFMKDRVTLVGPIGCLEIVAFKKVDHLVAISSAADIQALRVGVPFVHRTAVDYAERNHLNFEQVNTRDSLFKMLDYGRFPLVIDGRLDGLITIRTQGLTGRIIEVGPILHAERSYFVLSNRHADWAIRIQKAFDESIRDKTWQSAIEAVNQSAGIPASLGLDCLKAKY